MKKSNLYCVLADAGLGLHNSGRTYLCCHSRKYLEDNNGDQIYLDSHSPEDAWNSPTRLEIQQALENNIEHPNCQACWDDEHAGKKSRRQYHNEMNHSLENQHDQPQILDLKLGNTCNMRCRTCNPEVSSQWYREDWELNAGPKEKVSFSDYLVRWRRITDSYRDENQKVWETLKAWLPNTKYIDFYGAEPMLIKKNFEILQAAVDQGTAKNIELHINTNGTIWNSDHEKLLSNFKKVFIDFSIDDIKDRCGYIRNTSTWDLVGANLEQFIQARDRNKNFNLSVCITINNLNIYYLDEIFDHLIKPDLPINFNMLHSPEQLNIKILPQPVKQAIADKLRSYRPDSGVRPHHLTYWKNHLDIVINFLNTNMPDAEKHFEEFHYYTRGLDRTRNQSIDHQLPEFADLIRPWFDQLDGKTGLFGLSSDPG
jgi:MoaA/NifB/PqqE/SkfB family radical SAM enzyme